MNIAEISKDINKNAHEKGFWVDGIDLPKKLMLIVSELAEAMEADRKNRITWVNMNEVNKIESDNDFISYFEDNVKNTIEDEMADTVIRCFDLCQQMEINLEAHILAKHRYNKTRPYLHDKKY